MEWTNGAEVDAFDEETKGDFAAYASEIERWIAAAPSFHQPELSSKRSDWHWLASWAYIKFVGLVEDAGLSKGGPSVRFVKAVLDLMGFEDVPELTIYRMLERERNSATS